MSFNVDARRGAWLDTGVKVEKGARVTLTASGNGSCTTKGSTDCPIGNPKGVDTCDQNPVWGSLPAGPAGMSVNYGAVAGKIGGGDPFTVGGGTYFKAKASGDLYLVFNDCNGAVGYSDNAGSYTVQVSVNPVPCIKPTVSKIGFQPNALLDDPDFPQNLEPSVVVSSVIGNVKIKRFNMTTWVNAEPGDVLGPGDELRTGPSGIATMFDVHRIKGGSEAGRIEIDRSGENSDPKAWPPSGLFTHVAPHAAPSGAGGTIFAGPDSDMHATQDPGIGNLVFDKYPDWSVQTQAVLQKHVDDVLELLGKQRRFRCGTSLDQPVNLNDRRSWWDKLWGNPATGPGSGSHDNGTGAARG